MRRPILDEAASASYELSEAEYADNEAGNTWVQRLLGSLVAILQWLQPLLTPNNYDTLVSSILEKAGPATCSSISSRLLCTAWVVLNGQRCVAATSEICACFALRRRLHLQKARLGCHARGCYMQKLLRRWWTG